MPTTSSNTVYTKTPGHCVRKKVFQQPNMEGKLISCLHALYLGFSLSMYNNSTSVLIASVQHFILGRIWIITVPRAIRGGQAKARCFMNHKNFTWKITTWMIDTTCWIKIFSLSHYIQQTTETKWPANGKCKFLSVLRDLNENDHWSTLDIWFQ